MDQSEMSIKTIFILLYNPDGEEDQSEKDPDYSYLYQSNPVFAR